MYATVIDSPVSIDASNELDPSPLKFTTKLASAAAVLKTTPWVFVSTTTSESKVPDIVTFSAIPLILELPFNVTLPIPFGDKRKSMFVSEPTAATSGADPVAWLVTSIKLTAEAVFWNLMYGLFESSSIAPASSITISFPFVSNTADKVGA